MKSKNRVLGWRLWKDLGEEEFYEEQEQSFGVEIVKGFGWGRVLWRTRLEIWCGDCERRICWKDSGVVFWAFFLSSDLNLHTLPASWWFFFLGGRDFGWSGSLEARGEEKGI
jgi:hypothetical protein